MKEMILCMALSLALGHSIYAITTIKQIAVAAKTLRVQDDKFPILSRISCFLIHRDIVLL